MKKEKSKGKDWEKDLEKEASEDSAREKSGTGGLGNRLSIRNRRFTFGGENLGRTIKGVIVDFVYLRTFYGKKFDEDEPNIPRCFALSTDGEDVEPHENVDKPINPQCEDCPKNEWGSGKGRAKACQDRRRMGLIHEDDLDDVENATIAILEIPVTSLKNWSKFVKECKDKLQRPVYGVLCELGFDEDESYPVVTFTVDSKIKDKETVDAIKELREPLREQLMTPYEESSDDDDEKPKKGKNGKKSKDDDDDEDEDDKPKRKKKKAKDDDEDDDDEDDDKPKRKGKKASKDDDDEDEDEDSDDDDEDDDDEDEKPKKGKKKRKEKDDDDDEDDDDADDEDDEDDDEDDEEDDKGKKGKGVRGSKRRSKSDDDDDDDDDDEDEDDDDDDAGSGRKGKSSKGKEDKGGKAKRKKGSRFGK